MYYRKDQEMRERKVLSEFATQSAFSKGRKLPEGQCDIRTDFQIDRDRILHSKAFRRLAHKTQVFISPMGDHYRTRLTHTLEVAQIARNIARALSVNEDLTEAIALGHDLGHTPFGHTGEHCLKQLTNNQFSHNKHSLRVVDLLENEGKGLNLTFEVRDGIINHPTSGKPSTIEGKIVQLSDKIAYINHDIDDAIRGKVLKFEELPRASIAVLGETYSERIYNIISNIINESQNSNQIKMSPTMHEAFYSMRQFLFDRVYIDSIAKTEEAKAERVVGELFNYYKEHIEEIPNYNQLEAQMKDDKSQIVCDYIAGMTDRYATKCYMDLFCPKSWQIY